MEDIIIIGAGVTGCAIARELSRDQRKILVLEKGSDVCVGTSKPILELFMLVTMLNPEP